jgi:hypothetical protein
VLCEKPVTGSPLLADSRANHAQVRYTRYPIEVVILVKQGQATGDQL